MMPPLFATTFLYSACKTVGVDAWPAWLAHWLKPEHLDDAPWPGLRTLGQLARVRPFAVFVDGSTYITRARCVAAGHFLRKAGAGSDVWVTVDDDVFVTHDVLARLVAACEATHGLVALPYLNRDGGSMTFRKVSGPTMWQATSDQSGGLSLPLRKVDRVGMGCVAMHRDFVSTLDRRAAHFEDEFPALFLEGVQDIDARGIGTWVGEDYWLCGLAESFGLETHVLLDAPCEHAGALAKLDLDGQICVVGDDRAKFLSESITKKEAAYRARQERQE